MSLLHSLISMIEFLLRFFDAVVISIFCIIFVVLGYRPPWWSRLQTDCTKKPRVIPGPPSLPLIGTTWSFFLGKYAIHQLHEHYKDVRKKYGAIAKEEYWGNIPIISVFEKGDIIKVVKSGGKYPLRPPVEAIMLYRRSRPDRYASSGLVNEQGEAWHHLRTTLTPVFSSPKTVSSFLPEVHAIVDDWCNLIKQSRDSLSSEVALADIADRLGLELTCALVLGQRMGFLLPGAETQTGKSLAAAIRQHFLATRDTYYGLPFWKLFPTATYKRLSKSEETIYDLALQLVRSVDDSKDSIVFQAILKAPIDEREKTAAIVDFMSAGIHTLKNSLLFLLHLIGQQPQIQKNIVSDETGVYSKACLTESFRLLPTANPLARILEEDMELSGYRVQAGTPILCHFGIACREEANFKDADSFNPERWLNEEKGSSNAMLLIPFGSGRRICPGKRLMEHVLPVILEQTVKNFEIVAEEELETRFEFMLAPTEDIKMVFKDRV